MEFTMTEPEWVACNEPGPMLEFLSGQASSRKLRLFVAACYRRIWHLPYEGLVRLDEATREAVDALEQQAEAGLNAREPGPEIEDLRASLEHLERRRSCLDGVPYVNAVRQFAAARTGLCGLAVFAVEEAAGTAVMSTAYKDIDVDVALQEVGRTQAELLRDVFGQLPFRPVSVLQSVLAWRERFVARLAHVIYDTQRWGEMPGLAYALRDAGCDNVELLNHCRTTGAHVRGCWALDLILGRQ
jgi:hypothetical protein